MPQSRIGGSTSTSARVPRHRPSPTEASRPRLRRPGGHERTFATLGQVTTFQPTLLGGGEPRVRERAHVEHIELDDGAWIDVAREWLLGADWLLEVLIDRVEGEQG